MLAARFPPDGNTRGRSPAKHLPLRFRVILQVQIGHISFVGTFQDVLGQSLVRERVNILHLDIKRSNIALCLFDSTR